MRKRPVVVSLFFRATTGANNPNLHVFSTHASHVCSQHSFGLIRVDFQYRVIFTRVNKIEAMYGKSRVNVKVEPCSISLLRGPFIHCLYFTYACKFYVRSHGKITLQWKSTQRVNGMHRTHLNHARLDFL